MLASFPASMLNHIYAKKGIPYRFILGQKDPRGFSDWPGLSRSEHALVTPPSIAFFIRPKCFPCASSKEKGLDPEDLTP